MIVVALSISIVALLLSGLVALAVMELVADRSPDHGEPADDAVDAFDLPPEAEGTAASLHGLPRSIDATAAHLVLVVSPMCATCAKLVNSFDGAIPDSLTVVVTAANPLRMRKWAADHGLAIEELVFDDDMAIVNGLGVSSSPAGVGFIRGRAAFAVHLGGHRALDDLLEQRVSIRGEVPSPAAPDADSRPVVQGPG